MKVVSPARIEEIFAKWKLPLTFDETERLTVPTVPNTMSVVTHSDRILAFPTPRQNQGLNILNLRALLGVNPENPPSFYDHPWYLEEAFVRRDCQPGWHVLSMELLPGSIYQPYNYYYSLSSHNCTLQSAIETVLMVLVHYEMTGERLLFDKHTWCIDEATLGRFVTVG